MLLALRQHSDGDRTTTLLLRYSYEQTLVASLEKSNILENVRFGSVMFHLF